jgi:hypothetical protein
LKTEKIADDTKDQNRIEEILVTSIGVNPNGYTNSEKKSFKMIQITQLAT